MNENLRRLITEVVATNFEELAFMFAESTEKDELPPLEGPAEAVKMTFTGHFKGQVMIAIPDSLSIELAGNMLGMDEDDEQVTEAAHDSLKEMLNVITGHLLTSIAGTEVIFDLSVPQVGKLSDSQWSQLRRDKDTAAFELEDSPLLVNIKAEANLEKLLEQQD